MSVKNTIKEMRRIYADPGLLVTASEVTEILNDIESDYEKERR